jgi:hypothetical protein
VSVTTPAADHGSTALAGNTLRDTVLWLVDELLATARAADDEALAGVLADCRDGLDALPGVPMADD